MPAFDFPADLLALEARAWQEIQAGRLTVASAQAVQEAVTAFAAEAGYDRYEVEMGLKRAVRHPEG
ncbi:hypothetical protein [Streptomyces antibioticus]|uniref:hypothetical protein n=1 Tax=Streptomyces antibioticus TaxID=1890 RepID=UPI0036FB024F